MRRAERAVARAAGAVWSVVSIGTKVAFAFMVATAVVIGSVVALGLLLQFVGR